MERNIIQICGKNKNKFQTNHLKERILKQQKINSGYLIVCLRKNNSAKKFLVHRLVAEAFLEKHDNTQVNHKDENKLNNKLDNLEWCNAKYNATYNNKHIKLSKLFGKIVIQYDLQHNEIARYVSSQQASFKTKIPARGIRKACLSKRVYKNFYWEYVEK